MIFGAEIFIANFEGVTLLSQQRDEKAYIRFSLIQFDVLDFV